VCPGVKEGGVVSHVMNDVEIQCLPDDLPEFVEVDLSQLLLGHSIHVNELPLPKGVELVARVKTDNPVVVTVQVPREVAVEEPAAAAAAGATPEAGAEKPDAAAADKKEPAK
jgi:large subunit ribosomal protein L25